tara:strand:- start:2299 stop:3240 length:942 start_codon:yes stop_codon:yes gene_type:complete
MGTWKELVDVSSTQTLTNKTLTAAALGSSTATTQSSGTNNTTVATTAYADAAAAAGDITLADGKIWVGNGSGAKAEVTLSGDVTVSNSGVTTIGSGKVSLAKIKNQAANTVLVRDANDAGVLSAKAVADTQVLIGDGTGFTAAALSGDATMTNAGAVTVTGSAGDFAVTGDLTVTGNDIKSSGGTTAITMSGADVAIAGDLTVTGKNITTTAEVLKINDNTIVLNADLTTSTDVDAGIVVERGTSVDNATFYWDEGDDRWRVGTNDDADLSTSPTYGADLMQVRIDGGYQSDSEEVPIGHLQYHDGSLYVRTA